MLRYEVVTYMRQQAHDMARDMARLDGEIRAAYAREDFARVGELEQQREDVQVHRSEIIREVWEPRRASPRQA